MVQKSDSNHTDSLTELASKIAKALGSDWSRSTRFDADSDRDYRQYLVGPDHAEIFLSNNWAGKGRLSLSGNFPHDVHFSYQEQRPSITVAETATPERIAKEISRRLLPEYLPLLAKKLADKLAHDTFEANKLATFKAALEVIGYAVESHNGTVREEKTIGPEFIHLRTLNETQVQLDRFQVTVEQLRKIKAVVPELFRKDGR